MADDQTDIPRWEDGPDGFLPKANQQMDAIERGLRSSPSAPRQVRRGALSPFVLARVTESASLATNRWKYAWTEIVINGDDDEDKAGGRSGTITDNYAISLPEINATGSGVQPNGIDLDGQIFTDNPGIGPVPLGDNAPVLIYMAPNQAGGLKPLIVAAISIDGECA